MSFHRVVAVVVAAVVVVGLWQKKRETRQKKNERKKEKKVKTKKNETINSENGSQLFHRKREKELGHNGGVPRVPSKVKRKKTRKGHFF